MDGVKKSMRRPGTRKFRKRNGLRGDHGAGKNQEAFRHRRLAGWMLVDSSLGDPEVRKSERAAGGFCGGQENLRTALRVVPWNGR